MKEFVDAMDVCNEMMRRWFLWRKSYRKARWKRKWTRLITAKTEKGRKDGEIEMTRQEAIETIRMAIAYVEWECPLDYAVAFDMAIEALSQPEIIRCQECMNKECMGRGGKIVCGITGEQHAPDWYCKDGERGEEEDGQ